jgi:hypothetical protein
MLARANDLVVDKPTHSATANHGCPIILHGGATFLAGTSLVALLICCGIVRRPGSDGGCDWEGTNSSPQAIGTAPLSRLFSTRDQGVCDGRKSVDREKVKVDVRCYEARPTKLILWYYNSTSFHDVKLEFSSASTLYTVPLYTIPRSHRSNKRQGAIP